MTDAFTELFGEPLKLYRPQTSAVKSKRPVTKADSFPLAASNTSLGVQQVEGGCSFKSCNEELKKIQNTEKKIRTLKDIFNRLFGEDSDEEREKSKRPWKNVNVSPAVALKALVPCKSEPTVKVDLSSKSRDEERTLSRDPKKRKSADIMKDLFGEDSDKEKVRSKHPWKDDRKTSEKPKCEVFFCLQHAPPAAGFSCLTRHTLLNTFAPSPTRTSYRRLFMRDVLSTGAQVDRSSAKVKTEESFRKQHGARAQPELKDGQPIRIKLPVLINPGAIQPQ